MTMLNSIYRPWVPKWLALVWHLVLFVPLLSVGSVYSVATADTVGTYQLWSEDFTFVSLCSVAGIVSLASFYHKLACIRRHRLMLLWGFGVLIVLSGASARAESVWMLGFLNWLMGMIRLVLVVANLSATARLLLGVDLAVMLGPQGDPRTTTGWDEAELKRSLLVPVALCVVMWIGQLGLYLTGEYICDNRWQELYRMMMALLAVLMVGLVVMEKHRGWADPDESLTDEEYTEGTMQTAGNPSFLFNYLGNITATSLAWCAVGYVLIYGKTLDWLHSPRIWWACLLAVVGFVANRSAEGRSQGENLIEQSRSEDDRYIRRELWHYKNIRRAFIIFTLAMAVNVSSSLTNAVATVGLAMDTYTTNMLANWAALGYFIAALTIVVLRKRGIGYRWIFALGFLLYAWTMWQTYNQVQPAARYEDIRLLTIVRNAAMLMLQIIIIAYAFQRLPMRLFPSWVHVMLIGRSVLGPALGVAFYGVGLQYYQQLYLHTLAAASDSYAVVRLQSTLLAVKQMAGWSLWLCLVLTLLMLIVPWRRRTLKPAEIPDEIPS